MMSHIPLHTLRVKSLRGRFVLTDSSIIDSETPLHVASMLGHEDLVKEILNRKPELAQELDSQRSSPLHLACAKGYVGIVKALLSVNPEMCLARDRDGRNPLHLAAIKGQVDVLKELLHARPQAARETVPDRDETILHLCVIHNQLETLKLLVGTIGDLEFEFVNSKDDYGNTILHLAVADKQIETIEFLLRSSIIEVNIVNSNGLTAMDILVQSRRGVKDMDIVESLWAAGALRTKDNPFLVGNIGFQSSSSLRQMQEKKHDWANNLQKQDDWLEKKRSTLMVVASLIATMAFQAGLNPPSRVWQDELTDNSLANLESPSLSPNINQIDYHDARSHRAGSSIMAYNDSTQYEIFLLFNTIGFIASLSIILLLISGLPFRLRFFMWILMVIMWIAVSAMYATYVISVFSVSTFTKDIVDSSFGLILLWIIQKLWICLIYLLIMGHIIRIILKIKIIRTSRVLVVVCWLLVGGCWLLGTVGYWLLGPVGYKFLGYFY